MNRPGRSVSAPFAILCVLAAVIAVGGETDRGNCFDTSLFAWSTLPDLVYGDRPDSMLALVNAWEEACGYWEPIVRTRILGSIWDGSFDEGLYDERIIDSLLDYDSPAGFTFQDRTAFDDFTTTFADQLLPHVPVNGIEEFFCLFYAGQTAAAWSLLRGEALAGTDLRRHYDRNVRDLREDAGRVFVVASGGYWDPFGTYAFAGEHALTGLQYGLHGRRWFLRGIGEVRLGRTARPYRVNQDGLRGMSDRFDALLLGCEVGCSLGKYKSHGANVFAGAGLDAVQPFGGEDGLLQSLHLSAGGGYRFEPGGGRSWFLSLDYRREWIGARNERATHLYGDAWSLRAGVGWNLGGDDRGRLRRLQG